MLKSMKPWPQPTKLILQKSISACELNGKALLDDAKNLFDWERYPTALALSILAQEEFAKAFLLQLVLDGALPWLPEVHRSMVRHECKHLLAIVMEWLPPWENLEAILEQQKRNSESHRQKMDWMERRLDRYKQGDFSLDPNDPEPVEEDFTFPIEIANALNIYRHEQIEKLRYGHFYREEETTGTARKTADGWLDREKQRGFYIDITKTGEVGRHPKQITHLEASAAISRAERLSDMPVSFSDEYRRLCEVLPAIFSNL